MTGTIPLGELITIRGGGTPSRAVPKYWNGSIRWATVKDFKSTVLAETEESITPEGIKDSASNVVPAGSVIVPTRMAVGKAAINTIDLAINQDLKALLPGSKVESRFLLHFMLTQGKYLESQAQGATVKGIKLDLLRSLPFPNISSSEQCRIAAILDKADAIRRKREQALALADDFLKSSFLKMFGDPMDNPFGFSRERIGDRLSKARAGTQSGPFGSALKKHEYTASGVPVWGVENVQQNRFKGVARLFISQEKYEALKRYNVVRGDILISRAGTVGRMCIADPVCAHSIISTNLVRVSLDQSKLMPEYFVCLFTYFADRLSAMKANNKDAAFTFLNPKTLREIKIPIPEIARQQSFARLTRKLDGLLARSQNQCDGLSDLFSSLSQRAFRGEL